MRQDELIHAKPGDLPKIFQVTVITGVEMSSRASVAMTPRRNVAGNAALAGGVPPHNVLPGGASGSDEYEFLGHCFEKLTGKTVRFGPARARGCCACLVWRVNMDPRVKIGPRTPRAEHSSDAALILG